MNTLVYLNLAYFVIKTIAVKLEILLKLKNNKITDNFPSSYNNKA